MRTFKNALPEKYATACRNLRGSSWNRLWVLEKTVEDWDSKEDAIAISGSCTRPTMYIINQRPCVVEVEPHLSDKHRALIYPRSGPERQAISIDLEF